VAFAIKLIDRSGADAITAAWARITTLRQTP
jgi:hypothetical protein